MPWWIVVAAGGLVADVAGGGPVGRFVGFLVREIGWAL
jgi:hypothetical protein